MKSETTFIYALCEPDSPTRTVRYIGKADRPENRLRSHIHRARNGETCHRPCWIRSLLTRGLRPKLVILREVPVSEWQEWEQRYIHAARCLGMSLTNSTDGGDGRNGHTPSPESIAKRAAKLRGRKQTPEHVEKRANAKRGKKLSPEACAKLSARMLGNKWSPESIAKRSATVRGSKRTPETRAKMSAAASGAKNHCFGTHHTPEHRAKIGAALKAHYSTTIEKE